jgi:hypothetical protein
VSFLVKSWGFLCILADRQAKRRALAFLFFEEALIDGYVSLRVMADGFDIELVRI